MKTLICKECQENLKWALLPTLLILAPMGLLGVPGLMDPAYLFYVHLVAALFGAVLGFLQVFPEAQGDKRSLLLHRPLSRSRIFLSKAVAGVGTYLVALGIPFACLIFLAATPGHVPEPFGWRMVLPLVADLLAGLVYYFAGMLAAQRQARWYGSRCLGLAAGLSCSYLVWILPEFHQALVAIGIWGAVVGAAAWGSFLTGGAYAPQPRLARITLAITFLLGLSALSFVGKSFIAILLWNKAHFTDYIGKQGQVLFVHEENGKLQSITNSEGQAPQEIQGQPLDYYTLKEIMVPTAHAAVPRTRSYRNSNRALIKYENETKPGNEEWWYVPDRGRLLGYDKQTKRLLGSFGPDGFQPPDAAAGERFRGELAHISQIYMARIAPYLAFPGGVYTVNFRKRTVHALYIPSAGETVLWADRWRDEDKKLSVAFVGTDRSIHVLDETGSRVLSAPLAYDREHYQITSVGRLEQPERYWVWYQPGWYRGLEAQESMPSYLVVYDRTGQEISPRQELRPRPGLARHIIPQSPPPAQPSPIQAWSGLFTSPVEAIVLVGSKRYLETEVAKNNGTEIALPLQFLLVTTPHFVPGMRWLPRTHPVLVMGFAASMLATAVSCGLGCWLLARRHAFSRASCLGWSACGLLWGPVGLLLMLAVQEWPAHIACPRCSKLRVVTRDACEHCGALHAQPAADGTEVFESGGMVAKATSIASA
jgi:hypothetical protein